MIKNKIHISLWEILKNFLVSILIFSFIIILVYLTRGQNYDIYLKILIGFSIILVINIFYTLKLIKIEKEESQINITFLKKARMLTYTVSKNEIRAYYKKENIAVKNIQKVLYIDIPNKHLKIKVDPIFSGFSLEKRIEIFNLINEVY